MTATSGCFVESWIFFPWLQNNLEAPVSLSMDISLISLVWSFSRYCIRNAPLSLFSLTSSILFCCRRLYSKPAINWRNFSINPKVIMKKLEWHHYGMIVIVVVGCAFWLASVRVFLTKRRPGLWKEDGRDILENDLYWIVWSNGTTAENEWHRSVLVLIVCFSFWVVSVCVYPPKYGHRTTKNDGGASIRWRTIRIE